MKHELWRKVAEQTGHGLSPAQKEGLCAYQRWLGEEAYPAGAIGPGELDRLHDRHIADSLLFLHGLDHGEQPATIWDLGSGAGLPGIPLAILLPGTEFSLIDRSGRRVDLLRRAVRLLDLPNVEVERRDIDDLTGTTPMIVSRATLGPATMAPVAERHLEPGGVAVLGGSWTQRPQVRPGWEAREIPPDSLDQPVWLLIMRR